MRKIRVKHRTNAKRLTYSLKSTLKFLFTWHLKMFFPSMKNFYPNSNTVNLPRSHNYMLRTQHMYFGAGIF